MIPLRRWFAAARPRTLFASACPVIVSLPIAWKDGAEGPGWFVPALACAVLLQIGANLANDYWDWKKGADTSARKGPPRMTASGAIPPRAMLGATVLVFALATLLGLLLVWRGGFPILAIGAAAVASAIFYTAGPFPLAYLGLGELFTIAFFGPLASAGAYYLAALEWSHAAALAGLVPGGYSVALIEINNLRDIEEDRASGKRTLAARFGVRFGMGILCVALWMPWAVALLLGLAHAKPVLAVAANAAIFFALWLWFAARTAQRTGAWNPLLGKTATACLATTAVFVVAWMIP